MLAYFSISSSRMLTAAGVCFVVATLGVGFSVALTNIAGISGFLCWLFSGRFLEHLKILLRDNLCRAVALFLFIVIISLIWSEATFLEALGNVNQYRRLIFFFALFALCKFLPNLKRSLLIALFVSSLSLALCSVAVSFGVPGFPAPDPYQGAIVIKDHISQGFLMGLLVLMGARYAMVGKEPVVRIIGALAVILAVVTAFYLTNGRTGYVCVAVALMMTAWRALEHFSSKTRFAVLIAIVALTSCVMLTSSRFEARMTLAVTELQEAAQSTTQQGPVFETSMGLRYRFWKQGFEMFKESPLIGKGVGSYASRHGLEILNSKQEVISMPDNPHSDYVSVAAQWGLVGLTVLFLIGGVALYRSRFLVLGDKLLLQGTIGIFSIGAVFNCFLTGNTESTVLTVILAVLACRHQS